MQLVWVKNSRNTWYRLADLDLAALSAFGVYVLWHGGFPSRVVWVGCGDIATALREVQQNPEVELYAQTGPLFVTWAAADLSSAAGICRYLSDRLRPLIEDDACHGVPIAANSPF